MPDTRGKLMYARSYLADLYEEIGEMPSAVGVGFAQRRVSDAIDAVDAAIHAIPRQGESPEEE